MQDFYKNRKVLITGHTGFKGSWMCHMLNTLGAEVFGYSLEPPTDPSLYNILDIEGSTTSKIGDIRDFDGLLGFVREVEPSVVIHMAAQPLVIKGYADPRETYETNVMGTVNILECVKDVKSVRSFLNVTTDKVYENLEDNRAYVETDPLNGLDPYSNSKSCSELVTHSYKNSFFKEGDCAVSTARAGNVIGGGDFAKDRIIPDCVRAAITGMEISLRNPNSTRPYQHVLEPIYAYLAIAMKQYLDPSMAGCYNVGPEDSDCITTGELANLFCDTWGDRLSQKAASGNGPHEANYLRLNNTQLKERFGIAPRWNIKEAVSMTVEWTKVWNSNGDVKKCMDDQIRKYLGSV